MINNGEKGKNQKTAKIIINRSHNMNKIKDIINAKDPHILVLESEKSSYNIETNSIAYKLIMDYRWLGIEQKTIKRNRDDGTLLRITLIPHQLKDRCRLRHADAEAA